MDKNPKIQDLQQKAKAFLTEKGYDKTAIAQHHVEELIEELSLAHIETEMQKQINRSDAKFSQLFDAITDPVFIHDLEANFLLVNQTAAKTLGYTREEFSRMNILDIIPDENKANIKATTEQLKNEGEITFEYQLRKKNGGLLPVEFHSKVFEYDGKPAIINIARDLTERKRLEQELRKNEEKFRSIFNSINDSIFIHPQLKEGFGTFEDVNEAAAQKYGYTKPELLKMNAIDLSPPKKEFKLTDEEKRNELIENKKVIEAIQVTKAGKKIPVEISLNKLMINNRLMTVSVVRDITERKKAEEKLNSLNRELRDANNELDTANEELVTANEELYNTNEKLQKTNETLDAERNQFGYLLNSIPENIYVACKKSYEIVFANQHLTDSIGRNILGEKCYKALRGKKTPCDVCPIDQIFSRDEPVFREMHNDKLNKDFYHVDRAIKWMDGRDARFQIAIDITKIKEAERQLEALNATKDKFMSIISHDLKSPFNTILGFSDMLIDKLKTDNLEQYQSLAETIKDSSYNAFKLLENLLQWSRAQIGKIDFNPVTLPLNSLAYEAITLTAENAKKKKIELLNEVPKSINAEADENMLNTVLRNLISNAIKFTPRGGTVKVKAQPEGANVRISVADTGVGMKQSQIDNLFRINKKVSTFGTEQEQGTGLGLLICNEFVEKHGSRLTVNSEVNKGTEFSFYLKKGAEQTIPKI